MAFKVKVSKSGYNVNTCEDKDLVFSSDWDTFKIKKEAEIQITEDDWTYDPEIDWYVSTFEYNHNLGYVPFVKMYAYDSVVDGWLNAMTLFRFYGINIPNIIRIGPVMVTENSISGEMRAGEPVTVPIKMKFMEKFI